MRTMSLALRHELVGLGGVVERNLYLVKRYVWWDIAFFLWTVANTLTIVFIAKGIPAVGGRIDVERVTTILLVGAVIWAYLGIIFEILTETVAWERWEGTIEYTFMAPLSRPVHLFGMGAFAIVFVIGPDKAIKLILVYPMTTGRNFDEVLRVIDSLQLTANHKVSTPVNWQRGEDVIIAGSVSNDEAKELFGE